MGSEYALPPPEITRWTPQTKAAVVLAVHYGHITIEEALTRWQLTEEEYLSWQRAYYTFGLPGLRSTRVRQYRGPGKGMSTT